MYLCVFHNSYKARPPVPLALDTRRRQNQCYCTPRGALVPSPASTKKLLSPPFRVVIQFYSDQGSNTAPLLVLVR